MATPLAERHCEVCKPGTPSLDRSKIDELVANLEGWAVDEADGHLRLSKTIRFKGFEPGVELVNRIAQIAEQEATTPTST